MIPPDPIAACTNGGCAMASESAASAVPGEGTAADSPATGGDVVSKGTAGGAFPAIPEEGAGREVTISLAMGTPTALGEGSGLVFVTRAVVDIPGERSCTLVTGVWNLGDTTTPLTSGT